ncbi:MAG TPA: hypothetical protein PKD90_11175 [Phnomibacter sp.]|nr:hypothetical protein [Phnomibacter sp.]
MLLGILCVVPLTAQLLTQPVSARYFNLNGYTKHGADVFSTRQNPAALCQLEQPGIGAFAERRFLLQDLQLFQASAHFMSGSSHFGVHAGYFGFSLQNQMQGTLQYARKVSSKAQIGAGFHFMQIRQANGYGNASAVTFSLGGILHASEKVHAGFSTFNPMRLGFGKNPTDRLPATYAMGLGFDASEQTQVAIEMQKEEGQPINVLLGFNYRMIKQIVARAGASTQTSNYFLGFSFVPERYRFDIALSYQPQLGWSPGVGIQFTWPPKHKETLSPAP